jgi:hypothetical protein
MCNRVPCMPTTREVSSITNGPIRNLRIIDIEAIV